MHGCEEFPVVVGEFTSEVLGARVLKCVGTSLLGALLRFHGRLSEEHQREREKIEDEIEPYKQPSRNPSASRILDA